MPIWHFRMLRHIFKNLFCLLKKKKNYRTPMALLCSYFPIL